MTWTTHIKREIKHWSTWHKAGPEPDIFLFSMPRSGTTWLMEMVASQPGFKMVNEPFDLRQAVVREHLGIQAWDDLLKAESRQLLKDYLQMFRQGKDRDRRFKRPSPGSEFYRPRTQRIIFKILFAGEDYISWFEETFQGGIIYLLRHPIPVSMSREVHPRLDSFLNSGFADHFSAEQIAFAQNIQKKKDHFACAVLDWCLQNALVLKQQKDSWLLLTYEQLVMEPEVIIETLTDHFGFDKPERMWKRLYKASGSTVKSNADSQAVLLDPEQLAQKRSWLIDKWKDQVSQDQIQHCDEILSAFEIDIYQAGESKAQSSYWLKGKEAKT